MIQCYAAEKRLSIVQMLWYCTANTQPHNNGKILAVNIFQIDRKIHTALPHLMLYDYV